MIDTFLFVGLPYLAIVIAIVGCVVRWKYMRYSISSLSSQFLESKQLLWGSTPWHVGIIVILLGHIIAGFFPQIWSSILTIPGAMVTIETAGIALSTIALLGLLVLIIRRLTSARVQSVTSTMDLVVLALLLAQVVIGLLSAVLYRYGSAWSTGTVSPYFWSLLTLRPDMSYVVDFPILFKLHIVLAWILILLLPFTRLIHVLAVPIQYLWRSPQLVLWNNRRHEEHAQAATLRAEGRRDFIRGFVGLTIAGGLFSLGAGEKLFNFFKGPSHDDHAESELLAKKLQRLRQTAEERELELERRRNEMIFVSRYAELSPTKGKYFIDYQMAPGLAFKGEDGLPLMISAKCTHLGCTVNSEVDSQGRILCPCHVSYFDIKTGKPNDGAPAKDPLPHLGWALVDGAGKVLLRQGPGASSKEKIDPQLLSSCSVYITQPAKEGSI